MSFPCCLNCQHVCVGGSICTHCGSDPMREGDLLCVDCDANLNWPEKKPYDSACGNCGSFFCDGCSEVVR